MRATNFNLTQLGKYGIKPIVLTRNIFDCIVSMRDHILKERKNNWWPMAYINNDFFTLSEAQQVDFVISFFVPWYLQFYVSWEEENKKSELLWIDYEDATKDLNNTLEKISAYLDIKIPRDNNTVQQIDGGRLNKGVSGRGKQVLSIEQISKVQSLALLYPSSNFSRIGL